MGTKRASLASALRSVAIPPEPPGAVPSGDPSAPASAARWAKLASRVGKKTIAGHFDPAVSRQLKQIGLEGDCTTQELLREAISDLFVKYGKAPIASTVLVQISTLADDIPRSGLIARVTRCLAFA